MHSASLPHDQYARFFRSRYKRLPGLVSGFPTVKRLGQHIGSPTPFAAPARPCQMDITRGLYVADMAHDLTAGGDFLYDDGRVELHRGKIGRHPPVYRAPPAGLASRMGWTVQSLIDEGMTVHAYCQITPCHHRKVLDLEALKAKLGPDAPAMSDDLLPKMRCSKCGGKQIGLIYSPAAKCQPHKRDHKRTGFRAP